MVHSFRKVARRLRKLFSRSEWVIHLLKLETSPATAPALILVQIDGLSHGQFESAVKNGRMPFVKSLMTRENHTTHRMYSGLPSNTPAFQAEFFYGVKGCVPAFSFLDKETGKVFKMFDPFCAETIEKRLEVQGEGLLKGGSAYCNIYSGGADEPHFCASKLGWGSLLRPTTPPVFYPLLFVLYIDIFIRAFFLMVVEFFLALLDCVKGTIKTRQFMMELNFIGARVLVAVLLREIVVMAAMIDVARGLPVIQLNLLGYDEQAHRRGPSSRFAHWALGGIDYSIARLWRAGRRSERRDYDLWVYSDHGQEYTRPYQDVTKVSLEDAVVKVFEKYAPQGLKKRIDMNIESEGMRLFRGNKHPHLLRDRHHEEAKEKEEIVIAAMGPVGHVYTFADLDPAERERLAKALVEQANIPLVLTPLRPDKVEAWTMQGKFTLPDEAEKIFGPNHPFLKDVKEDLLAMVFHPNAGEFLLMGWTNGQPPMSFPLEAGAHAGIGVNETDAFALVSADATLRFRGKPYLRATDLREAARRYLGRPSFEPQEPMSRCLPTDVFRLATYNVHGCRGLDGKISPERIARVLARHEADAVCLQEVDVMRLRSGSVDQADIIASKLEMKFHFHPVFCIEDQKYGNAILSRYPMKLVRMKALPTLRGKHDLEPRGALWVEIDAPGAKIQVISCHLSIWPKERLMQVEALMGEDWLGSPECAGNVVLCGDMNALPKTKSYKRMGAKMRDCQLHLDKHVPRSTYYGYYPIGRLDHIFIGPGIEVVDIKIPMTQLDKIASDHLPLVADLRIPYGTPSL